MPKREKLCRWSGSLVLVHTIFMQNQLFPPLLPGLCYPRPQMSLSAPATTRARALERVREIIFQVLDDRDVRVYLFGSSVTGRVRRSSDIDVAIDPLHVHTFPSALLAELRERLEESEVPYDVDIVDLSVASPEIRARIEREGLLWRG